MPAKHGRLSLPALAVLTLFSAAAVAVAAEDVVGAVRFRRNDRAPRDDAGDGRHAALEARADHYQLISTSNKAPALAPAPDDDGVASSDLPAAEKQYDYPLVRPVYAPFVTRPPTYAMPYVEILDHHRHPPFVTQKPSSSQYLGSPMVSTVVVQDMSQTPPRPGPSLTLEHDEVISEVDNFHHLSSTKIPFTNVQVVSKPIGGNANHKQPSRPNFTDKLEETSLEDSAASSEEDGQLLENPPNLDLSGVVEEVVKKVFQENKVVLQDAGKLIPKPDTSQVWPCPPVTCCTKVPIKAKRRCSTFVKCISGRPPECPTRAERVPQALALTKPSNGYTNATEPKPDVRDGEPRFKKKKILKKKKKLLKKFLLPLLLAYKLLFLLILPLLVNGMMMMMSSSGMAGFFFALIGASITMVRVYSGATQAPPPPPPPPKVVKVIKYIESPTPAPSTPPPTTPAPTPTIIHTQPWVEEHHPTFHHSHHPPSYGSYYPHPYWNRHFERSEGALDGGRKKRRRIDESHLDDHNLNGILVSTGDNEFWVV